MTRTRTQRLTDYALDGMDWLIGGILGILCWPVFLGFAAIAWIRRRILRLPPPRAYTEFDE